MKYSDIKIITSDDLYYNDEKIKEKLINISKKPEDEQITIINDLEKKVKDSKDILWSAGELAKEGQTEDALCVAEYYMNSENLPKEENKLIEELNQKIESGEEVRVITTVLGELPWLVQKIIAQFNNDEYKKLIDITEVLLKNENIYIRMQAIAPLSALTQNLYAERKQDGTDFYFKDKEGERERVVRMSFYTLEKHKQHPRFLEYLTIVFSHLRRIDELQALKVLKIFFYKNYDKNELQEDYVVSNFAPLAIYFAEFVKDVVPDFNTKDTKDLLLRLINDSTPRLESTLVWHIWKTIEEDPKNLERLREYIEILFNEKKFSYESGAQYCFLIEKISTCNEEYSINLYRRNIKKIIEGFDKDKIKNGGILLHYSENILEKIAKIKGYDFFIDTIEDLKILRDAGCYIGEIKIILNIFERYFPDKTPNIT